MSIMPDDETTPEAPPVVQDVLATEPLPAHDDASVPKISEMPAPTAASDGPVVQDVLVETPTS